MKQRNPKNIRYYPPKPIINTSDDRYSVVITITKAEWKKLDAVAMAEDLSRAEIARRALKKALNV